MHAGRWPLQLDRFSRQCRDLLRHLEPNSPAAAELERLLKGDIETWQATARLMGQFKKLSAEQREEIEAADEDELP